MIPSDVLSVTCVCVSQMTMQKQISVAVMLQINCYVCRYDHFAIFSIFLNENLRIYVNEYIYINIYTTHVLI